MEFTNEELLTANQHIREYKAFYRNIIENYPDVIIENEPEEINDLVISRTIEAAKHGDSSMEVLHDGYKASPVSYVEEIIDHVFHKEINTYDAYEYYVMCKPIFEKYPFGDDFIGTYQEDELYNEISAFLKDRQILHTGVYNPIEYIYDLLRNRRNKTLGSFLNYIKAYKQFRPVFLKYRTENGVIKDNTRLQLENELLEAYDKA